MTRYCKDMCIVCFAPKRYDSQWLYAPVSENSHETCVSEVGLLYQDLIQVSLTCKESGPQYVCNYCKTQLSLFNKFKLKALDAYKKVSDEAEEQESGTDNLVKVEEITVFDVSTKQTEKFEIQYLDDHEEEAADIIEIEDSKTFLDEVPGASANGLNTHQNSISVNSSSSNSTSSLYHIKCQLCSKFFDSNESFNVHWKEHEELPQYSFGTISQFDSGESDLEIIDFDGRINDQLRHPFRNGLQLPGCSPRSLFNSADPEELSYISNMTTSKQNRKCYMTEKSSILRGKRKFKMSSGGGKRKRQEDDEELVGADSSDDDMSQKTIDEIKKKRRIQNKIRCQRYRDKKKTTAIVNSQMSKHQTVEEEEKIKRRKEQNKQKSQRYRDKKRATNLINCQTKQSPKTVVRHFQNFHNSQIASPSTRNVPYISPTHTAGLSTWNKPYIPESYSVYDDEIHNDTPSQVNYVPQLHEPVITNYAPNNQIILLRDAQDNTQNMHSQHNLPVQTYSSFQRNSSAHREFQKDF